MLMRVAKLAAAGAFMIQFAGCAGVTPFFEFVQTVFLGVTAAGSIAILRNV
jgi:hypothetical protein